MQCYISESLEGLDFKKKYRLSRYADSLKPLVIFGMYRDNDMYVYLKHVSEITVVWQGSDAKKLTPEWAELIRSKQAKHYAISHWIEESLLSYGIDCELMPVSATIGNMKHHCPRGDSVYFYSSDQSKESADHYGEHMIDEIKQITGLNVIRGTYNTFTKEELVNVYRQCFVNLRLTTYDGCPNTNLEIGLMGRRSIFNGDIPHSIKWNNVSDICDSIMMEYKIRHSSNIHIALDVKKYVNLPNKLFL
jgi:hypothetical protein